MDKTFILGILSPLLLTVGGIFSWFLKARRESLQYIEEKAREKRLQTYNTILSPYIVVLTSTATEKEKEAALKLITTVDYKKASFDLITFGSDETVRSYNKLMQFFFNNVESSTDEKTKNIFINFSNLLLSIRKDLYGKNTNLKRSETLAFFITDIDKYKAHID